MNFAPPNFVVCNFEVFQTLTVFSLFNLSTLELLYEKKEAFQAMTDNETKVTQSCNIRVIKLSILPIIVLTIFCWFWAKIALTFVIIIVFRFRYCICLELEPSWSEASMLVHKIAWNEKAECLSFLFFRFKKARALNCEMLNY